MEKNILVGLWKRRKSGCWALAYEEDDGNNNLSCSKLVRANWCLHKSSCIRSVLSSIFFFRQGKLIKKPSILSKAYNLNGTKYMESSREWCDQIICKVFNEKYQNKCKNIHPTKLR